MSIDNQVDISRNPKIDAMRGTAIFMVVLGHSIIYYPINLHEVAWCQNLFLLLSSVHMPLFFLLSGFCYQYKGTYKEYITNKIKRLMIPYLIFNLLDIAPRALFTGLVNRNRDVGSSIRRIIFNGGEYWFLYTLFLIFCFFPFVAVFVKRGRVAGLVVAALTVCIRIVGTQTEILCVNQVCIYLVFFYLGYSVRIYQNSLRSLCIKVKERMGSERYIFYILLILVIFCAWALDIGRFRLGGLVISLMGILVCYAMSGWNWFEKILVRFGKYSLPIYLLNEYMLVISRTFVCKILQVDNPAQISVGIHYLF